MPTFDEAFYLAQYPDVAAAVARGDFSSGEEHFQLFGQAEGRLTAPLVDGFDEAFYLDQNPDVAAAVARGDFSSGEEHFQLFGRAEGRLLAENTPPPVDGDIFGEAEEEQTASENTNLSSNGDLNSRIDSLENFATIAEQIGEVKEAGFTITFSENALALKDVDAGGEGEFDDNPSGDNVIAYAEEDPRTGRNAIVLTVTTDNSEAIVGGELSFAYSSNW